MMIGRNTTEHVPVMFKEAGVDGVPHRLVGVTWQGGLDWSAMAHAYRKVTDQTGTGWE
jgi:hypothetical protein